MALATEREHSYTTGELEAELEELRRELHAKSARNGAVELGVFFAVLLGLAALLAVAFKLQSNNDAALTMQLPDERQHARGDGGRRHRRCA